MHMQVSNTYMDLSSINMLICAFMLLYIYLYACIGVFWLVFGLVLHQLILGNGFLSGLIHWFKVH